MNPIQRIARNSMGPLVAQLINKVVDLAFVALVLHNLGPDGNGRYAFAVTIWLYTKAFTDFGLGVLTTRDVARDHSLANSYLGLTTLLRLVLWVAALPPLAAITFSFWHFGDPVNISVLAIVFLTLSIIPDSYSDAANAIFNAFERMDLPAILTIIKNLLKVAIGIAFILGGWGPAGLALTALLTNLITAGLFGRLLRVLNVQPTWHLPWEQARQLLRDAAPLLLNNLLAGLFFRVDAFVLSPTRGAAEYGAYDAAYKFLNLVLLIPQYFTLALFPHLGRLATQRDGAFAATYTLALKLLIFMALPISVATTFLAPDLIYWLGGREFLPDAGLALQILIWFLPFSYVNGMIQYVLIAAGQQRALLPAFILTALFNVITNLLFTPQFGFRAAAIITIGSEVVLLIPFLLLLQHRLGHLPPPSLLLRPLLATAAMGICAWFIYQQLGGQSLTVAPWAAAISGGIIYLLVLLATGAFGPTEQRLVQRLLGRAA